MPKEYIEREKLLTHLNERLNYLREENGNYDHYTDGYEEAVDKVEDFPPADVVEVVRCKDCKHATFYSCKNDACYKAIICEYEIATDDENFFCCYGERKDEGK